jgi:hypothetical protein
MLSTDLIKHRARGAVLQIFKLLPYAFGRAGIRREVKKVFYSLRVSSFTGSEDHERAVECGGSPRRRDDFITVSMESRILSF